LPKLKPEELESRRQEIIEGARTCFLRNGFHKTTTDEICREASITPGGLYHYFSGKDQIISAVIEQSAKDMLDTLRATTEEAEDTRSAFQRASAFFIDQMQDPERDNVARLDIEIWAETLKNEKLAELNRESWALRREWLENLIKRGVQEGVYHSERADPRGLSSLFMAILIGLRVGKLLWRDDFDLNGAILALYLMNSGGIMSEIPIPEAARRPVAAVAGGRRR
jgi:AcrR family transcriptional regulator